MWHRSIESNHQYTTKAVDILLVFKLQWRTIQCVFSQSPPRWKIYSWNRVDNIEIQSFLAVTKTRTGLGLEVV